MRAFAIVLLFLLVGCGTSPSQQQWAQKTVGAHEARRAQTRTIHYGDTMLEVHQALSNQFIPFMDIQTEDGQYSIDAFTVSYYSAKSIDYLALYQGNTLVAIAPWNAVEPQRPRAIWTHLRQVVTSRDRNKCDLYSSPDYYEKLIANIQQHAWDDAKSFVRSEKEIQREIAGLSDEQEKQFTTSDAAELAVMSPFIVMVGVPSVIAAAVITPVVIPVQSALEAKHEKEPDRRTVNTPQLLTVIRDIPLGHTLEETNALQADKIPGIKPGRKAKTRCKSLYTYQLLAMKYDGIYLYHNDRTFVRLYVPARTLW